jgi:hypothetical protein
MYHNAIRFVLLQNVNVLESTLQTALLPHTVFDLWQEAAKMFDEGKLAGQNIQKRSSAKKPELTQNQVCALIGQSTQLALRAEFGLNQNVSYVE